ncbi:MAG: TlpA disulfide reductase family protein [Anaeromyxobacteraceae bacterium]
MRLLTFSLTALLTVALPAAALAEDEIGVGLPAPGFTVKTLNPEVAGVPNVSLGQLVGPDAEDPGSKVVLLTFFASWCKPCQKEMPFLIQLDRMYREQGLRVVAVNIDQEEKAIALAKQQITAAGVRYPVLSDRFNFLARRYLGDKAPLPSVFIIDREGNVTKIERGYSNDASTFLLAEVQAGLGLKPATKVPAAAGKHAP